MDDTNLSPQEADRLAAAQTFASEYLSKNAQDWERDRAVPRELFTRAGDAGLLGLLVPADLGGSGISYAALLRILETLAYADMAAAFALIVHNNHTRGIAVSGSEHLIDTYLADMISGVTVGAFLLTEPQGGSDAAAITTMAADRGDHYVINGAKAWISNTPHADLLNVFAQTDPGLKSRGILSIQVPVDADGVTRLPAYEMMGGYAIGAGGFEFHDVRVQKAQLMLPPGQGFGAAMVGIDIARAGVAAMCAGMLRAGLDTAMPRILSREAFGKVLADQQGLAWQLADVATDLEAARLLAFNAASEFDKRGSAVAEAAHAKKFATRAAFSGIQACMQAMGADGLKQDHPLARHLAAAKMAEYLDGTTEIQNLVISRELRKTYEQ